MEFCKKFVFFIFNLLLTFNFTDFELPIFDFFKDKTFSYVEIAREKYANDDVVGRLYIKSLSIDVPVVQYTDNDYYLNHDEYKKDNNLGAIFLDYRNSIDIDRKILIYGHNSKTLDTEFKKLESFLSSDFYNFSDNKKIVIETLNKKSIYEVASIFVIDIDFQHMRLSFSQGEWKKHIDWINSKSLHDDNLIEYDDEILIMQTCYYEPDNSYLLVVGKKLEEEYY